MGYCDLLQLSENQRCWLGASQRAGIPWDAGTGGRIGTFLSRFTQGAAWELGFLGFIGNHFLQRVRTLNTSKLFFLHTGAYRHVPLHKSTAVKCFPAAGNFTFGIPTFSDRSALRGLRHGCGTSCFSSLRSPPHLSTSFVTAKAQGDLFSCSSPCTRPVAVEGHSRIHALFL